MQAARFLVMVVGLSIAATSLVLQEEGNPLAKVWNLMDALQAQNTKQGDKTEQTYNEYLKW